MASTRLPGKILADLSGKPLLSRVIERARRCRTLDTVAVATSLSAADDSVAQLCDAEGIPFYRGSENDVLKRYSDAATHLRASVIVRLTADCPVLDPAVIDRVVTLFWHEGCDYASNVDPPTFPDGLDAEVFSRAALELADLKARLPSEREHVTPYIRNHPEVFRAANLANTPDLSKLRWTVDVPSDLEFIRVIYRALGSSEFGMDDMLSLLAEHPGLSKINDEIARNEGYAKSLDSDKTFRREEQP
jgi:spore coat polysaccharide biosynthesis protein SpsF